MRSMVKAKRCSIAVTAKCGSSQSESNESFSIAHSCLVGLWAQSLLVLSLSIKAKSSSWHPWPCLVNNEQFIAFWNQTDQGVDLSQPCCWPRYLLRFSANVTWFRSTWKVLTIIGNNSKTKINKDTVSEDCSMLWDNVFVLSAFGPHEPMFKPAWSQLVSKMVLWCVWDQCDQMLIHTWRLESRSNRSLHAFRRANPESELSEDTNKPNFA